MSKSRIFEAVEDRDIHFLSNAVDCFLCVLCVSAVKTISGFAGLSDKVQRRKGNITLDNSNCSLYNIIIAHYFRKINSIFGLSEHAKESLVHNFGKLSEKLIW
jgi:hypothetical protein